MLCADAVALVKKSPRRRARACTVARFGIASALVGAVVRVEARVAAVL
jgi:hypothetical protein